jgi:uncharacterized protein involved in type VI secretion and phage assembly
MPAQASLSSQHHVAGVEVLVGGAQVSPETRAAIVDVRVQDTVSLPSSAVIRISDPEMTQIDSPTLAIGKAVEIKFAQLEARSMKSVFKGTIVALEPEFSETGCEMTVRAYDKSHALQRERAVQTFQQMSASQIVTKLLDESGLTGSADSTSVIYEFFMRKGETVRELIARFEREYNYRFWMDGDQYRFKRADVPGAPLTLTLRENLISFRPRATTAEVSSDVDVRGWDPKGKQVVTGTGTPTQTNVKLGDFAPRGDMLDPARKVLVGSRVVDANDEANELAKSLAARKADAIVEAEGTTLGDPRIRAATRVKIDKVGTRFAGEYLVSSVTHVYNTRGYKSHFRVSGASTRGLLDLMRPPERRDWSQSLVVGVVTNNNDPDAMGRVRVKFPALSDSEESHWARIASVSAGNTRGVMMLPQPDEEVIVGFENGDPRRPIIVGSLFNGKDKPGPDLLQDRDGSFAILTDEKAHMQSKKDMVFKSDQNMLIEVKSDQKTKVQGSAEHETTGSAKLKAQTYTVEAGSTLSVKGVSVTVEASASLTLKGATIDVQASGPLNLKGAIINIG